MKDEQIFGLSLKCSKYAYPSSGSWNWSSEELEHELQQLEWEAVKRNQPAETGFWQRMFGVKK